MKPPTLLPVVAALLALVACGGGKDPVAENAEKAAALPDVETAPPDEMTSEGDVDAGSSAAPGAAAPSGARIPLPLRGRWALSPADCANQASVGVLVVAADELRFHDSRARPAGDIEATADYISGDFGFTGDGKSWTRFQSLQLQGDRLIRAEQRPNESYTYARCG